MALADSGLSRVPGLVAIDIADYGRRYMISDRPSAWLLELALHLGNSVLLVLFWAMLIEPNVHGHGPWSDSPGVKRSPSRSPVSLVAPRSSLGFMGWRTGSARFALTNLLLHAEGSRGRRAVTSRDD